MATNPAPNAQPSVTAALKAPVTLNASALRSLGQVLSARFIQYRNERKLAEIRWTRNARQYLGIYDPEIEQAIDRNRSRAYPKLTRVKCVSMLSRLMNLLFQGSDKNWTLEPSPMPDLSQEDLQQVLNQLTEQSQGDITKVTDEQILYAIKEFARKRCERLEARIEDQLEELGGSCFDSYVALCRKVINSGIQYGCGILRGPFVEEETVRSWQIANGQLVAIERTQYKPMYEWIPVWDYYPDISARSLRQMDGQFLRRIMNRQSFLDLKKRPDFFESQLDEVLRQYPQGNYVREAYETELRSFGPQINTPQNQTGKFECIIWDGIVQGAELAATGVPVPEKYLNDAVLAQVWMVSGTVIKAEVNPWVTLVDDRSKIQQYHHFIFEEDESFIMGNGLPNIMRDSQLGLCAATRMLLDNGSVQRVFELNRSLLMAGQDVSSIQPDMLIYRDDDNPQVTGAMPALRPIDLPMHIAEMTSLVNMFQGFADQETFVGPATGGDMQKGPSEPFRTAAGASMLRGDAALPFKDVVRNFDAFTESLIGSLILFNQKFNPLPEESGDFTPVPRGATSLMAKEVQGIQIDNLAATLTDEEKPYLNARAMLAARLRVRDLDPTEVVYDDKKCDEIDTQRAQQQQQAQQQAQQVTEAQVRKTLSEVLKNIAQANKNSAGAEASIANVILQSLEKGVNPDMLAPSTPQGATNESNDAAGNGTGEGAAGAPAQDQSGTGAAGLASAAGTQAQAAGSGFAAMPAR